MKVDQATVQPSVKGPPAMATIPLFSRPGWIVMAGEPVKRLAENAVLASREPRKTAAPERGRGGTGATGSVFHASEPHNRFAYEQAQQAPVGLNLTF